MGTQFLLRGEGAEPFPRDPEGFLDAAKRALSDAPLVWDSRRERMAPPVDYHRLCQAMYPKKTMAEIKAEKRVKEKREKRRIKEKRQEKSVGEKRRMLGTLVRSI